MRELPILFKGDMVKAVLEGRKTQTRRLISSPFKKWPCFLIVEGEPGNPMSRTVVPADEDFSMGDDGYDWIPCPYGQPGDHLWVRETWMPDAPRNGEWPDTEFYGCGMRPLSHIPYVYRKPDHCLYRATWKGQELSGWKPSIHMPRWASRITLEMTGVRVERLQDITPNDILAEGVTDPQMTVIAGCGVHHPDRLRAEWKKLWTAINGAGSWDMNPWVWAVGFRRVQEQRTWKDAVGLAATLEPAPTGGRFR